jgi:hypothetical protein
MKTQLMRIWLCDCGRVHVETLHCRKSYTPAEFLDRLRNAAGMVCGPQLLARVNRPPEMPRDIPHSVVSLSARAQCLSCHDRIGPQGEVAIADRPHENPKQWRLGKLDCLLCHHPKTPLGHPDANGKSFSAQSGGHTPTPKP